MTTQTTENDALPEWANRMIPVPEAARILSENPATYYRKSKLGIYPAIYLSGTSSRVRGWELWAALRALPRGPAK